MCKNTRKVLQAALDVQYNYVADKLSEFISTGDDQLHEGQEWVKRLRVINTLTVEVCRVDTLLITPEKRNVLIDAIDLYSDVLNEICLDSLAQKELEFMCSSLHSDQERTLMINKARQVAFENIDSLFTLSRLRTSFSFNTCTQISLC